MTGVMQQKSAFGKQRLIRCDVTEVIFDTKSADTSKDVVHFHRRFGYGTLMFWEILRNRNYLNSCFTIELLLFRVIQNDLYKFKNLHHQILVRMCIVGLPLKLSKKSGLRNGAGATQKSAGIKCT